MNEAAFACVAVAFQVVVTACLVDWHWLRDVWLAWRATACHRCGRTQRFAEIDMFELPKKTVPLCAACWDAVPDDWTGPVAP